MKEPEDSQEANSIRDKILQVFGYLKALNEHRNPAKRQLREHAWTFWLDDLPDHPAVQRMLIRKPVSDDSSASASERDAGVVLRVRRAKITQCPTPPESLREWLHGGWEKPENDEVRWIESLNETDDEGETVIIRFDDDEQRQIEKSDWVAIRDQWRTNELPARRAMRVFEQLYELHGRIERDSERLDLVVGDGLLSWQRPDGDIYHPLLIQRVQLVFEPKIPEFTIVDADFELELYSSLFESISDVDPKALGKCRAELVDTVFHPLDEDASAYLKRLALTLSSKGEMIGSRRPAPLQEHPVIGSSPVLFLRSRSRGLTSAIEQTIRRIGQRDDFCDALKRIVGGKERHVENEVVSHAEREDRVRSLASEASILFGKKSNAEQMKIAQRLDQHGAVLVQGPPGTGKSHTIANLIGHLLAQGKSVLVTSHTTKALKVLRDHVVPELRPLCVSVLDNDNSSRRQLEESVTAISSRLSESDVSTLDREASEFQLQRERLLATRQQLSDALFHARMDEYRDIVVAGDSIPPSDAARELRLGLGKNNWLPGPILAGAPLPLCPAEVDELYATNATTLPHDEQFLDIPFPARETILHPHEFELCVQKMDNSNDQATHLANRAFWGKTNFTTLHIRQVAVLSESFEKQVNEFKSMPLWRIACLEAGREGGAEKAAWEILKSTITKVVALASDGRIELLQHSPQVDAETPLDKQLAIAEQIAAHLGSGGTIGMWVSLTKRDWRPMIAKWSVRSGAVQSADHHAAICKLLRLRVAREQLAVLWDELMQRNGTQAFSELGEAPEEYCEQFIAGIESALSYWAEHWQTKFNELCELGFNWDAFLAQSPAKEGNFGTLHRIVGTVESRLIPLLRSTNAALSSSYQQARLRTLLLQLEKYARPEVDSLRAAISRMNPVEYEASFVSITEAAARQEKAKRRIGLLTKLEQKSATGQPIAGRWASAIRRREGIHGESKSPGDVIAAWRWRQLDQEITKRNETDIEQLQSQIEAISTQIDDATVNLIERRAWSTQVSGAGAYQQDLVGWLDIVRRIGKGYGNRVARLQSEARLKMRSCRAAVPVWIMPISRLVDNFDFARTQFDVVIIDEASQCDVMGLLAIALAKQVVVVGDHEQVSPSSVGQDASKVDKLIRLHLDGIPNSVLYDGRMSIYDLARQSFGGLICLLEHFRCTSDIIQFSNYLSYNGDIKPLRDNVKFKEQVVEYRVESALRRNKVNETEAEAIASLILAAIEFDEYEGLTFGVISLVGDEQALHIEQLLRRRMSPEVYESRRLACGNPAQFQGDERDVMFLSMVDTPQGGPLTMKQAASFQQRYNVAASRARNQMWIVHSLNADTDLKAGDLRKRLIDHARDPKAVTREIEKAEVRAESTFEVAVIKRLVAKGYNVRPQWKVGRYRIDIVVQDGTRRLAVECDGDRYHGQDKMVDDMNRQAILERLGWRFHRIRGTEFFRDPDAAMTRLLARLTELGISPTVNVSDEPKLHDSESLTQRLIRRAAEIRLLWDLPEEDEFRELLPFNPEAEEITGACEHVIVDPPAVEVDVSEISNDSNAKSNGRRSIQQDLFEVESDDIDKESSTQTKQALNYLGRTERQGDCTLSHCPKRTLVR